MDLNTPNPDRLTYMAPTDPADRVTILEAILDGREALITALEMHLETLAAALERECEQHAATRKRLEWLEQPRRWVTGLDPADFPSAGPRETHRGRPITDVPLAPEQKPADGHP